MEVPVTPIPLTRSFFGQDLGDLSDAQIIDAFATENGIAPDVPVVDIIGQMESVAKERIGKLNADSPLKATRRMAGDAAYGLDDRDLMAGFVQERGLSMDTPVAEVQRMMEDESRANLYQGDIKLGQDQVFGLNQLDDAVNFVRDQTGYNSIFTESDIRGAVDQDKVDEFLRPSAARGGFLKELGKAASGLFIPEILEVSRRIGMGIAAGDERSKALNEIENRFNNPESVSRFVAEAARYKQNPELFSEEEVANLRDAARLMETTSNFFKTDSTVARDFFGGMGESALLSIAKGAAQVGGSIGRNVFGTSGEFADSLLRDLNFTEAVAIDNDQESTSTLVGNLAGSTVQTIGLMLAGGGVKSMFTLFGTLGAGGNIETYRDLARREGFDPRASEEAIVGLGGAIISGALGTLSGKAVEQLPLIKGFVEGGQKALIQNALRDNLFSLGAQAIRGTLKNPGTIKEAVKLYGRFAASSGVVEAFEEVSEEALNEGLMNLAVDEFETDPQEFAKRLRDAGLGGLFGGIAIGPVARKTLRSQIHRETANLLGLDGITAGSPEEAAVLLKKLDDREAIIRQQYGTVPGSVARDLIDTRSRLEGIVNGAVQPDANADPQSSQILDLGDLLNESSLVGTGFDIAADEALKGEKVPISEQQRSAFQKINDFFQKSDLALEDPEAVSRILNNVYMTPLARSKNGRRAVTTTSRSLGQDGVWTKNLVGVYLTNEADEVSAFDEIFHIINDSRSDSEQQLLVDAYNQLYGTQYGNYNKDLGTRDRLASRAADILAGKDQLPENAPDDNEFVRMVRGLQNGEISQFASHLTTQSIEDRGVQGFPVSSQDISKKLTDGSLFRVRVPGAENSMTFQDTSGTVFLYQSVQDSDGSEVGRLIPMAVGKQPLERLTAASGAALVPYTQDLTNEIDGDVNAKLEELFALARARQRGTTDEDIDTALDILRQRAQVREDGVNFVRIGEGSPVESLTKENLKRKPIALLGPAKPRMAIRDNASLMETLANGVPEVDALDSQDSAPVETTSQGPTVASLFDPEVAATFRQQEMERRAQDIESRRTNASQVAGGQRLLTEGRRTPPDQRLLPPASPQSRRGEIMAAQRQAANNAPPIPIDPRNVPTFQGVTPPKTNPNQKLLGRGTSTPPEQRLLTEGNRKRDTALRAAGLTEVERRVIAQARDKAEERAAYIELLRRAARETLTPQSLRRMQVMARNIKPIPGQKLLAQFAGKGNDQVLAQQAVVEELVQEVQKSEPDPVKIVEIASEIAPNETVVQEEIAAPESNAEQQDPLASLSPEVRALAEALIAGQTTDGLLDAGVTDADTETPIFEVASEEIADQLIAAGVAQGARADLGSEEDSIITDLLPQFITLNPDFGGTIQQVQVQERGRPADVTPEKAKKNFLKAARPKKGPGSRNGNLSSVEVTDEAGDVIATYPNKASAINALENEYQDVSSEIPGAGNQDIVYVAGREFTVNPVSQNLDEVLTEQYGEERVARIGAVIDSLEEGTVKTALETAIRKTTDEIVRGATGNSRFSQENLDQLLIDLDQAIDDAYGETGIDQGSVTVVGPDDAGTGDSGNAQTTPDAPVADDGGDVAPQPAPVPAVAPEFTPALRKKVRRLRAMAKDGRLVLTDRATGTVELSSARQDSADTFGNTVQELGGVQTDSVLSDVDGKKTVVVQAQLHESVISEIFQEEDIAAAQPVDGTPFSDKNLEGEKANGKEAVRPTFDESVPKELRTAITNAVRGLKLRAPIHVTTKAAVLASDGDNQGVLKSINALMARVKAFILKNDSREIVGAKSSYVDENGVRSYIIAVDTTNGGDAVYETLSHELGHILQQEVLNREEHADAKKELVARHQAFVEESQGKTVREFLLSQKLPARAYQIIAANDAATEMTMSELRTNPATSQFYNYITSFDEWIADQTARWIASDAKVENNKSVKNFFKAVQRRLQILYKQFEKLDSFAPDSVFDKWLNDWATSPRTGDVGEMIEGDLGGAQNPTAENAESLAVVDPYMSQEDIEGRQINAYESGVNNELLALRDDFKRWMDVEDAVRRGQPVAPMFNSQEDVDKARNYERLFRAAQALRDRPIPPDTVSIEVIASYSTAPSIFGQALADRAQILWDRFRNSALNDIRRRVLSPVITRMQIVADDHPEIAQLGRLVDLTFASASRASNVTPYVDEIAQQITIRTGKITQTLDPMFKAFGYTGTTAQKALAVGRKGEEIGNAMQLVYLGARDKAFLTAEQLSKSYNGVTMEQMIDQVREQMDDLRNWAASKGILKPEDFIEYPGSNGREHYVPRVYDRDVVIENFESFRDDVIAKNLRKNFIKARMAEDMENQMGRKLTDAEYDAIVVNPNYKLSQEDSNTISSVSEQVAGNIAYGRTATMSDAFNDKFAWLSNKSLDDIIEEFGKNVPGRLKQRKLFFVPDAELFGVNPIDSNGRKINFMNTNIMDVMGQSIEQLTKRGTFATLYNNGQAFRDASEALIAKMNVAKGQGDTKTVHRIRRDLDVIRDLFESIAEIVDLANVRGGIQDTPMRNAFALLSRGSTMSVMGLSSILAVVETGNIPLRAGLEAGIPAIFKAIEVAAKKTLRWPGTIFGAQNYTDEIEDELQAMGIMHMVGEDFSSRNRLDPFNEAIGAGGGAASLGNNANISTSRRILRNLGSASEFIEDGFYRITMLEQLTRISQVAAAHAARNTMKAMIKAFKAGPLNKPRTRELARLGFADNQGNFDPNAFRDYIVYFEGLENARKQGRDAVRNFNQANEAAFFGVHHRVTTRLVNQMIARPNVTTRTRWGNSKNPLMRLMYRLRSFTHAYREMAGRFFYHEAREMYNDEGLWGLTKFLTRLLPLLMMSAIGISARSELSASVHEATGNAAQASSIRTRQAEKTSADILLETFERSGLMLQSSEAIGAIDGLRYGNSIWSVIGGVNASKVEKTFDSAMKSGASGDPSFIVNNIVDFAPAANTGAFDWLKMEPVSGSSKKTKDDMDFIGSVGGGSADWWK